MGTYMFEVDVPDPNTHFDLVAVCGPYTPDDMKPLLNRLLTVDDMPDPVKLDGTPVRPKRERASQ